MGCLLSGCREHPDSAAHGWAAANQAFAVPDSRNRVQACTGLGALRKCRIALSQPAKLFLLGADHHRHLAPFHARKLVHHTGLGDVGLDAPGQFDTQLLMRHLATTEADIDLDLVAFLEEPHHVAQLDVVVADVRGRAELQFLDLDLLGLLALRRSLLLLLELELAEIHDPADGRLGGRLDFDQIQARVLGHRQCLVALEDPNLLAIGADDPHARNPDFVVAPIAFVFGSDTVFSCSSSPAMPGAHSVSAGQLQPANARRRPAATCCPGLPPNAYARKWRPSPSRDRRSRGAKAPFATYARGFYSRFSRCANRHGPENRPRSGWRRPAGRNRPVRR